MAETAFMPEQGSVEMASAPGETYTPTELLAAAFTINRAARQGNPSMVDGWRNGTAAFRDEVNANRTPWAIDQSGAGQ